MPLFGFGDQGKRRARSGRETILFEKSFGGGFAYVAFLGKGVFGCAMLVRSISDGKLYVRKEDLRCDSHAVLENDEVLNAIRASRVGTVPTCQGWVKYQSPCNGQGFGVSY